MALHGKTSRIQLENATFLIERMAQDCSPFQYVRELTQNSFDALRRNSELNGIEGGEIVWDVDWELVAAQNIYKLQITDNAMGITEVEMEKYINRLSSSGGVQSMEENFGIGAKITAGVENPLGLVYKSWSTKNPDGILATFWKDPDQNEYGLRQYQVGDKYQHWVPLDPIKYPKPEIITSTGTSVVLMGKTPEENTFLRPGQRLKWLRYYLNERYFEIPKGVTLKVRDFAKSELSRTPSQNMDAGGSALRTINGKKNLLDRYAEKRGILKLSNAECYWYILPEELDVAGGAWDQRSQTGAIYQDELYEVKRLQQARAELIHFGVNYGFNRVVLYIKPDVEKLPVIANASRSALLINGEPLPWTQWHAEFKENMPQEIRDMMDAILDGADTGNYDDNIKRRWKEIKDLFNLAKYKKIHASDTRVDGSVPGGSLRQRDMNMPGAKSTNSRGVGGGAADLYAAFISDAGTPGKEITNESNLPRVDWIEYPLTRQSGDLEDRAARYIREENLLQINRDFRVFEGIKKSMSESYPHASEVDIKRTVEEWVTLQLIEAVMGILAVQGSPEWSDEQSIENALSSEALTTAIMPRYTSISQMKRQLGSVVGANVRIKE